MLYSITIFVALTGNLLLIFLVTKRPETRSLTIFLFVNMAAADLLVTMVVMPMSLAVPYTNIRWLSGTAGHITCKMVYFAFHVTIAASILSLTLMSVDRYLAVIFPLRRFSKFRRAKVLTAVIWLTSMIVMIPAAVLWKIEKGKPEGMYCQPAFQDVFGDFLKGVKGYYIYLFLLTYFFPLLVISVLYGLVCRRLWRRKMPGLVSSETERRREATKRRVVRTLVIVTAAFAICWLPAQCYHLIWAIDFTHHSSLPRYVMFVCIWCGHANSALNPWLYMLLTDKFRVALREVFFGSSTRPRSKSFKSQSSTRYTTVRDTTSVRRKPQNQPEKGNGLLKEEQEETAI